MIEFFTEILNCQVFSVKSVHGGDINQAYKIDTAEGIYFAKVNDGPVASKMLRTESEALRLLNSIEGIRVPEVISVADYDNRSVLILNWIEEGKVVKNTSKDLAEMLSILHHVSADNFGLDYENYIGSLPQLNTYSRNWLDFYYKNRINPQIKTAVDSGNIPASYIGKSKQIFKKMESEMPEVRPSLLHGDLWNGNFMIDLNGKAILIDPAIYYGHRELDIAMMLLFGGFPDDVIEIYNSMYPLDNGWKKRIRFYQMYYILVHVNLFGGSYSSSAMSIIDSYV
jgi:protein-ribulosamine 3-kinase